MWKDLTYYPTEVLKNKMHDCVEAEDYMHCARIRDEIERRKRRNKFSASLIGKTVNFFIYVGAVILCIIVISWVMTSIGNWINSLFS